MLNLFCKKKKKTYSKIKISPAFSLFTIKIVKKTVEKKTKIKKNESPPPPLQLTEYAADVDMALARRAVRAVGSICLNTPDTSGLVERLLSFLDLGRDHVTAEAINQVRGFFCVFFFLRVFSFSSRLVFLCVFFSGREE